MTAPLKAPFPYFGGKRTIASRIWELLGDPPNYVEPFCGSAAVLLARPTPPRLETINDADGFVTNVYRALRAAPEAVIPWCDQPPMEADMTAIHWWLVAQREPLTARLFGDPDYYDARIAGRWLYGIASWIGGGWCTGNGPWHAVEDEEGHRQLRRREEPGQGVPRQLLQLGNAGEGVHRQSVHLGNAGEHQSHTDGLRRWFLALRARLRYVRICCGDWARVCGPTLATDGRQSSVYLDPPYSAEEDRARGIYALDSGTVAHDVRAWCLAHGADPRLRIVLSGYGDVHDALCAVGWHRYPWKTGGGYGGGLGGRGDANRHREVLWASPHCLRPSPGQMTLF